MMLLRPLRSRRPAPQPDLPPSPLDPAALPGLIAAALDGEPPRALLAVQPADDNSEADFAAMVAAATAVHLPALLDPGAVAERLATLPEDVLAQALVLLSLPGASAESAPMHAAAVQMLADSRPATPSLLRALRVAAYELGSHYDDDIAPELHRRLGLHFQTPLMPVHFQDRGPQDRGQQEGGPQEGGLERLLHAQALLAPPLLRVRLEPNAASHLHSLYICAGTLPAYDVFGERLGAGLEARLLNASAADSAVLAEGMRGWRGLSIVRRRTVLATVLREAAAAMDMPVPELRLLETPADPAKDPARGWMLPHPAQDGRSVIHLDFGRASGLADSFAESVSVLLHELTHCWQEVLVRCPSASAAAPGTLSWPDTAHNRAMSALMQVNGRNYTDGRDYRNQPMEREAFRTQDVAMPRVMRTLSLLAHRRDPAYVLAVAERVVPVLAEFALLQDAQPLRRSCAALARSLPGEPDADSAAAVRERLERLTRRADALLAERLHAAEDRHRHAARGFVPDIARSVAIVAALTPPEAEAVAQRPAAPMRKPTPGR